MSIKSAIKKALNLAKCLFKVNNHKQYIQNADEVLEIFCHDVKTSSLIEGNSVDTFNGEYDLSIIIPSYNNAKYIGKCLDSVISQKTKYKFEVIVVNDGSTDNTSEILDGYSSYGFVKIIQQENKGFSGARNVGIDNSTGRYIMFVDSDDRLPANAIESLMQKAIAEDADIVAGSYVTSNTNGDITPGYTYDNSQIDAMSLKNGQPWGKVYKRWLFNNVRYPENYWYEDTIFMMLIWPMCGRCFTISDVVYEYFINPKGISSSSKGRKKSVDTLYVYRSLLSDRLTLGLSLKQSDYESLLAHIKLSYLRTKELPEDIQKCIYLSWSEILSKYYADFKTQQKNNIKLERAFKEDNYRKYCLACVLDR